MSKVFFRTLKQLKFRIHEAYMRARVCARARKKARVGEIINHQNITSVSCLLLATEERSTRL